MRKEIIMKTQINNSNLSASYIEEKLSSQNITQPQVNINKQPTSQLTAFKKQLTNYATKTPKIDGDNTLCVLGYN